MHFSLSEVKQKYGALKFDFRSNEGNRYYIYGFKHTEEKWYFEKGELFLVTTREEDINVLMEHPFTIHKDSPLCRECIKQKRIEQSGNTWLKPIWKSLPNKYLVLIQDRLLSEFPNLSWYNVMDITDHQFYFGLCTSCIDRDALGDLFKKEINFLKVLCEKFSAQYIMEANETVLQDYLFDHPELIEPGMVMTKRNMMIDNGEVDLLARDKNGTLCVIELKVVNDNKKIVWQSAYYQTTFKEKVRVITIAPGYSSSIMSALKKIENVEMKIYSINDNGFLQVNDFISKDEELRVEQILPKTRLKQISTKQLNSPKRHFQTL